MKHSRSQIRPLALVRRNRFELGYELTMRRRIHRPMLHRGARRIFSQEVVAMPIRRRPDGSWSKPATAVGTDIFQNLFDARHAEGAFIRTDPRLKRLRRQRLVAMFAGWSEFEHRRFEASL